MSALRSGSLLVVAAFATGCNGVLWGNLGVLCVTVAIFLGTVFLTRNSAPRGTSMGASRATASTSQRSASTSQHS